MLHEYKNEIHDLKQSNAHFAKVFEKHNALDKKIEDAEANRVILTDVELETLKKESIPKDIFEICKIHWRDIYDDIQ